VGPRAIHRHRRNVLVHHAWRVAVATCLLVAVGTSRSSGGEPRFLVFHLDAVSSIELDLAIAEGRVPNVVAAFSGGARLDAITLYTPGTEVIYPRLKSGEREEGPVGWGHFDRELDRVVDEVETFFEMAGAMPRRSRSAFIHGIPHLEGLAGAALLNVPDLLERYGVVEYFWFATDSWGHWGGIEPFRRSLEQFDTYLGALLPRLDLDRLNLILYADHGMTFSDTTIDVDRELADVLGDDLLAYVFPNVYLRPGAQPATVARRLAHATDLDYVFYRAGPGRVEGYLHGSFLTFEAEADGVRYRSTDDPLGYAPLGYAGEALSDDEWITLSGTSHYPAVPPNVFRYLQLPDSGDVVIGLDPPKIPLTVRANRGNHVSLTRADMVVPVLLRGPQLVPYYGLGMIWLHELYRHVPVLDHQTLPPRELHRLTVRLDLAGGPPTPAAQLLLSPAYRWRIGVDAHPRRLDIWGEYDAYSSFLTRWWLGAGASYRDRGFSPIGVAQVELDLAEFGLMVHGSADRFGFQVGLTLAFRVADRTHLTWHAPSGIGGSFAW
jgi:hypothetical protein